MDDVRRQPWHALLFGAPIGALGGLIGLGGAEFRLPVLKAAFRYPTHRAVVLNLAVSLITLLASAAIRLRVASGPALLPLGVVIGSLITGSMLGAYLGASYASRLSVERLERLIMILLVSIGVVLLVEAFVPWRSRALVSADAVRISLGLMLGLGIGLVSSVLGVAGGELIIPTLVFVFGVDIKLSGTASVLISLPTVTVGLLRFLRKRALSDPRDVTALVVPMGVGSIVGAFAGGYLVPFVPTGVVKFALGVILVISALRIFRHRTPGPQRSVQVAPGSQ